MNKTINIFEHYNTDELLKSLLMFLIVSAVPTYALIVSFIQIILLALPHHMVLLGGLSLSLITVFTFSSYLFIATLRQYNQIEEIEYKKLFYIITIPIAIIIITLVYSIGLTLI